MSEPSERPAARKPNNTLRWGARLVLLGILAVFVLLAIMEFNVQSQFNDSYGAVRNVVDKEVSLKDVGSYLKGSPNRKAIDEKTEQFVWKGPLFRHAFRLHHENGVIWKIEDERELAAE